MKKTVFIVEEVFLTQDTEEREQKLQEAVRRYLKEKLEQEGVVFDKSCDLLQNQPGR